jgi:hypothetical protein
VTSLRSSWQSVLAAVRHVRTWAAGTDASSVAESLRSLSAQSPWLVPLAWAGYTLDAVVRAVLVLLTTARLALVELVPAVWIGAITWDWRVHLSGDLPLPAVHGCMVPVIVVLVVGANLAAYWCNSTLAFAFLQTGSIRLGEAFADARRHARVITAWALTIGAIHAFVSVVLARTSLAWYGAGISVVVVLQLYALVALPVAIAGFSRKNVPRSQRALGALLTGAITLVALAPGFALNRLGLGLIGLGLPWLGVVVLVFATIVQVAATSSAHTVSLATKLQVARSTGTQP